MDQDQISDPDLVIVAKRVPQAVICLVSALAYHDITTQIPHAVSIALPKGAETPRVDYPPISVHGFSEAALKGVETHQIDGVSINIYCPEKTLADCFKFRNKLGMDIVLEALKFYKAQKIQSRKTNKVCKSLPSRKIIRPLSGGDAMSSPKISQPRYAKTTEPRKEAINSHLPNCSNTMPWRFYIACPNQPTQSTLSLKVL